MSAESKLSLPLLTLEQAQGPARELLQRAQSKLGFVPNMYSGMANSPGMLATYMEGYDRFRTSSGLTPAEQEVVFLMISRLNACEYCLAAHSTLADRVSNVPPPVTDAIRDDRAIPDAKLAALGTFVAVMHETRGMPSPDALEAFLAAGYTGNHVLEIILAIAVKTISNYTNHLMHTPVDPAFASRAWQEPSCACGGVEER